jgi:hypothetical protein
MRALILSALVASALPSQAPAPRPTPQPQVATGSEQKSATDNRGTKTSPLVVDTYAVKSQWDAEQERKAAQEHANSHAWEIGFQFGTIGIGLLTAGILIFQALIFRRQARTFHNQAVRLRESVQEVKTATEATKSVAATLASNAHAQLRAYVFVTGIVVDKIAVGEVPIATVHIKNSGLTPAYDVELKGAMHGVKSVSDLKPVDELKAAPRINIGPGGTISPENHFGGALSAGNMDELNAKKIVFYVYGKITYKDIYGRPHWTIYRSSQDGKAAIIGSKRVIICDDGNDCDKE